MNEPYSSDESAKPLPVNETRPAENTDQAGDSPEVDPCTKDQSSPNEFSSTTALPWYLSLRFWADLAIRFYQVNISPFLGKNCRYQPTCSQYARQAIAKYGLIKGGWKALCRILRCNPFFPGGFDPLE